MILLDLVIGIGVIIAVVGIIAVIVDTVGDIVGFFRDRYTPWQSKLTIIGIVVVFFAIATIVGAGVRALT